MPAISELPVAPEPLRPVVFRFGGVLRPEVPDVIVPEAEPGKGVTFGFELRHPTVNATMRAAPRARTVEFFIFSAWDHLAQLGCEALPDTAWISLDLLLGTSMIARTRRLFTFRTNITARELGAHTGSSPAANGKLCPRAGPSIGNRLI